ncbi:trichoplein keratin filament-binding protein [Arctopsyche grandis]|uniref:trichoplein keratin filament-binding protein n=1 Tax=Arctopsyche grandis TaxID=121162 RepID=UPI00406D9460
MEEQPRVLRAGKAAAAAAARRRAGEAAADAARAKLSAYWDKHKASAPGNGLPTRLMGSDYYSIAEDQARILSNKRQKLRNLEERQNKLSIMLFNENLQYQEELKTSSVNAKYVKKMTYLDSIPTPLLREINLGIKAKEEERQQQEAELKLYHQWRINNPVIQKYEKSQKNSALKSAWMEQIVESERSKKKEEEQQQTLLRERDERLKKEIEKEKEEMLLKEQKVKDLNEYLSRQINDLQESEEAAKSLQIRLEAEEILMRSLEDANSVRSTEASKRAAARKVVLGNMGLYARKVRERAKEAELDVMADQKELENLISAIEKDSFKEDVSRRVWKEALHKARESFQRQKELERLRQKRLEDAMDGEAKAIFQKQDKLWQQEHLARQELLEEVIATLKTQVRLKLDEYKEQQKQNILDRESLLASIEEAAEKVSEREAENKRYQQGLSKMAILQNQMKQIELEEKKLEEKNSHQVQLREAANEEERLRNEIIKLQREGCGFQSFRRRPMNWVTQMPEMGREASRWSVASNIRGKTTTPITTTSPWT